MSTTGKSSEQAVAQATAKTPTTACRKCGSKSFFVIESYTYKAELDEDSPSTLDCFKGDGGIDSITCAECGEDHTCDDFTEINFH
ncbi:MAG: hypothetical protein KF826_09475 [Xanthobacteraceae bacterium]|nr:hypothetical protein [Xanthobacteraceae bacterium]